MIPRQTVDEIKRLLLQKSLSQRMIARRLGVSRGTVNAIALGKRPEPRPRSRDDDLASPAGPPTRCPGCGALVAMPCLACRVRAMQQTHRRVERRRPLDRQRAIGVG